LDDVLAEYEAEHGVKPCKEKEKVDNDVEIVSEF